MGRTGKSGCVQAGGWRRQNVPLLAGSRSNYRLGLPCVTAKHADEMPSLGTRVTHKLRPRLPRLHHPHNKGVKNTEQATLAQDWAWRGVGITHVERQILRVRVCSLPKRLLLVREGRDNPFSA